MVDSAVVPANQERAHQGGRLEVRRRLLGQEVQGHAGHLLRKDRAVQVTYWMKWSCYLTHKSKYCWKDIHCDSAILGPGLKSWNGCLSHQIVHQIVKFILSLIAVNNEVSLTRGHKWLSNNKGSLWSSDATQCYEEIWTVLRQTGLLQKITKICWGMQ